MKFKGILTAGMLALAMTAMAQTHAEGVEYFKADQLTNAKQLLLRNLNNAGTDKAVSYYYLGQIALVEKKNSEANADFEKGLQENADYPYNYIGLGLLDLMKGDQKAAEANFKIAEKLGKKDASVQVDIARAYYKVDPIKYEKEIGKRIAKAQKYSTENPDIYIFQGDQYVDDQDYGKAGAMYDMAKNYDKNAPAAYVKYANLFNQVNPEYAIKMLKLLLQENPNSALGQRELANAYYSGHDFANAAEQYGKYVQNPNHFKEDEDRYSFLLFYDGKYKEGYDYATTLLNSNPSNFSARRYQFMNAAQLSDMASQLLPMADALYAAHKENPTANKFAPIDYTLIGQEYQTAKRYDEAANVLNEALEAFPTNANFGKQLASLYIDAQEYAKAADAYSIYMQRSEEPGYNDLVQQALYAYFGGLQLNSQQAGSGEKYFAMAEENVNKASEMAPNQYKPKKILGDLAIARASKEQAASAAQPLYEEAIVLLEGAEDPSRYTSDAKTIYNYLGNYWLDKKNVAKAKEYFNKYLTLDPNNADYRKFVDSLK